MMVVKITDNLWDLILQGDFRNFYIQLFNNYFPHGMFFWATGFVLFLTIHMKTKDFTYSGAITAVYFMVISGTGLVVNANAIAPMRYFGIVLGIATGWYIYRTLKG